MSAMPLRLRKSLSDYFAAFDERAGEGARARLEPTSTDGSCALCVLAMTAVLAVFVVSASAGAVSPF